MNDSKNHFDIAILGGGPGGYVAAIRAAQLGKKVALVEAQEVGGTCLNRGCIPSKSLIADADVFRKVKHARQHGISTGEVTFDYSSIKARKDGVVEKMKKGLEGLIQSNQITLFKGFGKFLSESELKVIGTESVILHANSFIIATGSEPRPLPGCPFDGKLVHDSTSFLNLTTLPKKLIVIGGGVIGCEFASLHAEFGVNVTIIEMLPNLIAPEGKAISDVLTAAFKKRGIQIETNAPFSKFEMKDQGGVVQVADGRTSEADCILVSFGRKLNSDGIGLEKTGVMIDKNGMIPVNEHMQTNIPHIYAIGDVTGKWLLAHVASHQGIVAADHATGRSAEMHYNAVPSITYTYPEIGTVGLTLEKALEKGYEATIGKFPFQALGKSQAISETEGFAQVVIDKKTGLILGAQVVGHEASTLISQMAVAIANELTVESIYESIHAHPTLPEAWLEASLLAAERPLHFPPKKRVGSPSMQKG